MSTRMPYTDKPGTVIVKPFIDREIFFSPSRVCAILHSLWPILRVSVVDAVQSSFEDIAGFQENCLYFATIVHNEPRSVSPDTSMLPSQGVFEYSDIVGNREENGLNFKTDPWPLGTISRSDYLSAWRDVSIPSQQ